LTWISSLSNSRNNADDISKCFLLPKTAYTSLSNLNLERSL